jgi:hypothetical protein
LFKYPPFLSFNLAYLLKKRTLELSAASDVTIFITIIAMILVTTIVHYSGKKEFTVCEYLILIDMFHLPKSQLA